MCASLLMFLSYHLWMQGAQGALSDRVTPYPDSKHNNRVPDMQYVLLLVGVDGGDHVLWGAIRSGVILDATRPTVQAFKEYGFEGGTALFHSRVQETPVGDV